MLKYSLDFGSAFRVFHVSWQLIPSPVWGVIKLITWSRSLILNLWLEGEFVECHTGRLVNIATVSKYTSCILMQRTRVSHLVKDVRDIWKLAICSRKMRHCITLCTGNGRYHAWLGFHSFTSATPLCAKLVYCSVWVTYHAIGNNPSRAAIVTCIRSMVVLRVQQNQLQVLLAESLNSDELRALCAGCAGKLSLTQWTQ